MKLNYRLDLRDFSDRIILFSAVTLVALFIAALFVFPIGRALSFLIGGLVSILNFKWLRDMVNAAVYADRQKKRKGILVKFFLRYGLILLTLYGILHVSWMSVLFALMGLFVALVAIFIEGFYQVTRVLRAKREGKNNA